MKKGLNIVIKRELRVKFMKKSIIFIMRKKFGRLMRKEKESITKKNGMEMNIFRKV